MTESTQTPPAGPATDAALAAAAQAGDGKSAAALLQKYRPLVHSIASHYFGASLESEDIAQEGMLALLSAVYAFRGDKNASFRTFAAVCITNRLRTVVKENAAPGNAPLNAYVPLDSLDLAADSDPVHIIISDEAQEEWFRIFENDLSSLENRVLRCFLKGYTYREIAALLRITEKAADNAMQRIRAKLKKRMETP